MKKILDKLKLIYLPFLIIAICTIAGYTFLNWFLLIKLQIFQVREIIVNFAVPFVLPWIPIFFFLRPRIKLLHLKRGTDSNLIFLYQLFAALAIAIPTIVAQEYLVTASGKLTQLDNITQIDKHEASKYYKLKNIFVDKTTLSIYNVFEVVGKNNEYFDMNMFVVLPIFASAADTAVSNCFAWYGIKYHTQISNRLTDVEKEERFKKFAAESQTNFDRKDLKQFVYFDRIGNSDEQDAYQQAIKNNRRFSSKSAIILMPVNEAFEARNGNKFAWIFRAFGIGALVWLIMLLIPKFDELALDRFKRGVVTKEAHWKENIAFFLPREGFYITPILMNLNILVYVIMVCAGLGFVTFKAADLLNWGANFKPVTTDGEWWRLLTNIFLHGGLVHVLANMYGLLFVGIFLEPKLGKMKFAIIYLSTGIIASLASLYFHDPVVSIGASGAIFGLYGVFLALLLTKVFPNDFSKALLTSTLIFIGYNLLMGFTGVGIDNAAHLGGLISGFGIGLLLYPKMKREAAGLLAAKTAEPIADNEIPNE